MKQPIELPSLAYKGHEKNKLTLHLFLQIIGKIRLKLTPRKNHWWYVTEYMDTQGCTTGPIPYNSGMDAFTITLNVHRHQLEVMTSKDKRKYFDLYEGLSVANFMKSCSASLKS